jgi:hypothetical protein
MTCSRSETARLEERLAELRSVCSDDSPLALPRATLSLGTTTNQAQARPDGLDRAIAWTGGGDRP